MSNDSTEPGYLVPVGVSPDYDQDLERKISQWVRGVTGLDVKMVLPRWTDPQQTIPKNGNTWCAFGIRSFPSSRLPARVQISEDESEQWSWENIEVILCFYGPNGASVASLFRAGIQIDQNNDTLRAATGLSLTDYGQIYNLPELINNQWVRRYDITVTLSRKNVRTYNVKSVITPNVIINGD